MSVASEITRLQNAKASLKSSINAKNDAQHQIDDETLDEFSDFVDAIQTGGGSGFPPDWSVIGYTNTPPDIIEKFNYSKNIKDNWDASQTNLSSKFAGNLDLVYMPLVDTSNATNVVGMFNGATNLQTIPNLSITSSITALNGFASSCTNLKTIDVSNFNTSNVTTFYQMFSNCTYIQQLDLTSFDSTKATQAGNMFINCINLASITFGNNFTALLIKNMEAMFRNCTALTELDLSNFETNSLENTRYMFRACTNLTKIDMRKFTFSNVTLSTDMFRDVPTNCLIIVKDTTEKTWITTNFPSLTNVQTVSEYEGN